MDRIKILIVEDHQIVSKGMEMILENDPDFLVIDSASDIETAYERTRAQRPDVILLDLDLGKVSGLDHIGRLKESGAKHVLVVTGSTDVDSHRRSIENGASGTVLKQEAGSTLIKAIKAVNQKLTWIDKSISEKLLRGELGTDAKTTEESVNQGKLASLTKREKEIVAQLVQGKTNKEIATSLNLQDKTVRNALTSIYSKLGVSRRLELAVLAPKLGLLRNISQ